jgi:hypothetical protein
METCDEWCRGGLVGTYIVAYHVIKQKAQTHSYS